MTGHEWTLSIVGRYGTASVHYCSETEARRLEANALSTGAHVTDGPRRLEERERGK